MTALNGEKTPIAFQLGDRLIDGFVVKPLSFIGLAECVTEAQNMQEPKDWGAKVRRARMARQVTYYTNGSTAAVSVSEIRLLPIPAARAIIDRLEDDISKPGKVIRTGDGIEQAIVYELGTPIPLGKDKPPITELEFIAKTYGEVEDVMAANDQINQASLLIATIAKPLGSTLTVLPSWAVAQISMTDGFAIAREVLPHFLGAAVES